MSIAQITGDEMGKFRLLMEAVSASIRVATLGIIIRFDPATQTATVQPAIADTIQQKGEAKSVPLPVLSDVPVAFPRGGDYAVTLPVSAGDACILIFADGCIDGFQQSGTQSAQAEVRHHDLSDAMAIVGISTGNAPMQGYNSENLEIRHKAGDVKISLSKEKLELRYKQASVELSPDSIKLSAAQVDINGTIF